MTLSITNGCFSYGVNSTTGCGNADMSKLEYATGSFKFHNSLSGISNPSVYAYQASISLHTEDSNNSVSSFNDTLSRLFDSFADLTSDPLWLLAS